jgi:GNAT superfamily N-acetyltransferase
VELFLGNYVLSDDRSRVDLKVVHGFLRTAYWSEEIPIEIVEASIANSLCFGIYLEQSQVAFARVVTDYATFAYLADVFVLPEYRGHGLSKWMMSGIMCHKGLKNVRRFMLLTRDAQGLYKQFGFAPLTEPERVMEISEVDFYKKRQLTMNSASLVQRDSN